MKIQITPEMRAHQREEEQKKAIRLKDAREKRICTIVHAIQNTEQRKAKEEEEVFELRKLLAAKEAILEATIAEIQTLKEVIHSQDMNVLKRRRDVPKTARAAQASPAKAAKAEEEAMTKAIAMAIAQAERPTSSLQADAPHPHNPLDNAS